MKCRLLYFFLSIIIVVVLLAIMLTGGENSVPLLDMADISTDSPEWNILVHLRVPRAMMALACGAVLSVSGCMMQAVFRNPLVEPYTMGLSGGAVVGVGVAWILGVVGMSIGIFAFLGAMFSMFIVLLLRKVVGGSIESMLLAGVVVSFVMSSVNILMYSLASHDFTPVVLYWSIGSIDAVDEDMSKVMFVISNIVIVVSPLFGRLLDVLSVGETTANHIGVDARKISVVLFCVAALLTALSVANVGVVAFVGMIVPHIVRQLVGSVHRWVLPMSGILGGAFLLGCDMLSCRIIYPAELPVGVFSGIFGGLFFVFILAKNRKTYR